MSLRHAILGFLSFQPFTGYDLKKAFDRSVRHFWPATQSQIYRTVAELDEAGWIDKEVVARDERLDMKIYHIADAGREELRRWLSTPLTTQETREPLLVQVYFAGQISDAELLPVLEHQLAEVDERLSFFGGLYESLRSQPDSRVSARAFFLSLLTLEYALVSHAHGLRWLKSAVTRLRAGDYTPTPLAELIDPSSNEHRETAA